MPDAVESVVRSEQRAAARELLTEAQAALALGAVATAEVLISSTPRIALWPPDGPEAFTRVRVVLHPGGVAHAPTVIRELAPGEALAVAAPVADPRLPGQRRWVIDLAGLRVALGPQEAPVAVAALHARGARAHVWATWREAKRAAHAGKDRAALVALGDVPPADWRVPAAAPAPEPLASTPAARSVAEARAQATWEARRDPPAARVMPFGRYRGIALAALPRDYVRWAATADRVPVALRDALVDELLRREGR